MKSAIKNLITTYRNMIKTIELDAFTDDAGSLEVRSAKIYVLRNVIEDLELIVNS